MLRSNSSFLYAYLKYIKTTKITKTKFYVLLTGMEVNGHTENLFGRLKFLAENSFKAKT